MHLFSNFFVLKNIINPGKDIIDNIISGIDIIIFLEGNIGKDKALRAANLSYKKYCSVSKILEKTANINHKVVLNGIHLE